MKSPLVLAATSLLACGKSEEAPAPVAPLPAAEVQQTESAPMAAPEASTPTVGTPSAAPTETAPASQPISAAASVKSAEAKPAAPKPDRAHGQQVYRQTCAFCHDKGIAGAPKIGDVTAWSPRLAQGMDTLYASALRGKGAMPAKGGNPSLADDDVRSAVNFLSAQAR
jgi:cytochrome c5